MKEFSDAMIKCMGQISQLSYEEIITLINSLHKEQETRDIERQKEIINNAIKVMDDLAMYYDYLEIEGKEIYLNDIAMSLENIKDNLA